MRRVFISGELQEEIKISGSDAHHIIHVLRGKVGQQLVVVDSLRQVAETEIIALAEDHLLLRLGKHLSADTEPPIEVTLAQSLPKGDKMDFIVQKAVELGVSRIIPVVAANCVVKYDAAKRVSRQKKWQKIADEAAKQCGRTLQPVVERVMSLEEVLENGEAASLFMCYEGEADQPIREFFAASEASRFCVLVGPEGGFSPAEVALCRQNDVQTVTMGPRILRTETASLAALSLLLYAKGDLGGRSK